MGKRGPVPVPPGLKILAGRSPGRDSGGRPIPKVPAFERAAPDPPDWLDPEALAEWDRIVPTLDALRLIKPEDHGTITARCCAWSRAVRHEAIVAARGPMITNPSGREVPNPAVHAARVAWHDVVKFGALLGLDPVSEVNLAASAADDDDDEYDQFAGGKPPYAR